MKKALLSLTTILWLSVSYGQQLVRLCEYKAENNVRQLYIPPDPSIFSSGKTASSSIIINYSGSWPVEAKAAFEFAAMIWEHTITSPIPIKIDAYWTPISEKYLALTGTYYGFKNFASTDPKYLPDTDYPIALANKMMNKDFYTSVSDITIEVNSIKQNDFYFGNDGNTPVTQYDFVMIIVHEIAHGLGWSASTKKEGTNPIVFKPNGSPNTYDNNIVDGAGKRLSSLTSPSDALTQFCTSDNLFFDGIKARAANNGNSPKLYAPATWEPGSSISHLHEGTFGTASGNALMTNGQSKGEAIHNPGAIGIGVLNDIGWEAVIYDPTGIEDEIEIGGYDPVLQNNIIPTVLTVGGTYVYFVNFTDYDPMGDYLTLVELTLEVSHEEGYYIHKYYSYPNDAHNFFITLNDLPTGYKWNRNFNGQVYAKIKAVGTDNDYEYHTDEVPILINYRPDKPELQIKDYKNPGLAKYDNRNCSTQEIGFFAKGTTYYDIYYGKVGTYSYYSIKVQEGVNNYEITGLDEYSNYEFLVGATNDFGQIWSAPAYRYACKPKILALPVPARERIKFIIEIPNTKIKEVHVSKLDNPTIEKTQIFQPERKEAEMQIEEMPSGLYVAKIKDDKEQIHIIKFLKE